MKQEPLLRGDKLGREGNGFAQAGMVLLPAPLTPHFLLQGSLGPPGPPGLGVSTGVSSWWELEGPKAPQVQPLCSFS